MISCTAPADSEARGPDGSPASESADAVSHSYPLSLFKSIYFANILLSVCPDRHFISIDEYIRVSRYLNINYLVTETLQIDDRIYQIVGVRNKNVWVFQTHYTCKQIRLESFGVLAHVFVRSQNVNTGTSTILKSVERVKIL